MSMNMTETKTLTGPVADLTVGDLQRLTDKEDPARKVSVILQPSTRPGEVGQIAITLLGSPE